MTTKQFEKWKSKLPKGIIFGQWDFPRNAEGVKCPCGGYAEKVRPTDEEARVFGCGREFNMITGKRNEWDCCPRAFVCCICGTRIVGEAEAPEMG